MEMDEESKYEDGIGTMIFTPTHNRNNQVYGMGSHLLRRTVELESLDLAVNQQIFSSEPVLDLWKNVCEFKVLRSSSSMSVSLEA